MSGLLVIGGGIAGQAVCEQVRDRDADMPITMLCGEPRLPYDRVRISHLLAGEGDIESLQLRPAEWYEDRNVDVRVGAKAAWLDPHGQACGLLDGTVLTFDQVVLATGSDALMPPIAGIHLPEVHAFRGPEDCDAIATQAKTARRAAVIGGGLLGLEAARGIAAHGCAVTVVHLKDRLMELQLDDGAASLLRPAMEELGVEVMLEKLTRRVLGEDHAEGLEFEGGERLACELVVVAIGIRANMELARSADITCQRGIIVDDGMVASHPRVLAVGECAEHRGVVYGIVAPIHEQAATAAATITEARSSYTGSVMSAKLKVMGIDLVTVGEAEGERAVVVADDEAGTYRKLVVNNGVAAGAVLLGDTRGYELLLDAVRKGREAADPLALLAEASKASAADLPDSAQICNCNGVCKGEVVAAIKEKELGSTAEVVSVTRAGAGCGTCKSLVTEILADVRGGGVEEAHYLCPCKRQTREELAAVVRERNVDSVSGLTEACGAGRDCGACKPGLAYLVSEINGNRHREERHARFINDRVHANIQRDGTFSVVPRIRGGVTTPAELKRIAEVAERHEIPMVKITGGQRIDLLGVPKEKLPVVWEDLGMPSGYAYSKSTRTVKTCVGTDFCRFGLGNSIKVGIELERRTEGLHTPHKVKSAVTGCPRNCAEAYVKDIGVVAIEGGWEIYIGGAAGATVRKGDLLATVTEEEEALQLACVFLQHYRESAEYLERTFHYIERVGIDCVREAVLDPENAAALLERFKIAKAAADPDPWLERHTPVHPKQFSELDTEATLEGTREPALVGPPEGDER